MSLLKSIIKYSHFNVVFIGICLGLLTVQCSKDDDLTSGTDINNSSSGDKINNFIWRGLNSWYLWQPDVPNLASSKTNDLGSYYSFLNADTNHENFFNSLLYQYGTVDRFSWIVDDYQKLDAQFQGTGVSFGYEIGLLRLATGSDELLGYVQYVLPNSPAASAGLKRGDIIRQVNGTNLNVSNYYNLLFEKTSYTLGLANITNNNVVLNGITYNLTAVNMTENPVYMTKTFDIAGKKIGYLVYNSFTYTFNQELNQAFADFKQQNITDFILDLRYNGGGAVETSAYLGSMINGTLTNKIFATLAFNEKHTIENRDYKFSNSLYYYDKTNGERSEIPVALNSLNNLPTLYVIVSGGSASASEMLINGLKPFMNVILIGVKTYGKNVGSITLYDSPSTGYTSNDSGLNTTHKWAMQPIVFKSINASGTADYGNGWTPNYILDERSNLSNLLPLGDKNELLLNKALQLITGLTSFGTIRPFYNNSTSNYQFFKDSKDIKPFFKEMYIK